MRKILSNPLFLIILLALLGRGYLVNSQLPYVYWHDEKNYIDTALRFGSGSFMPYGLSHGGFFYIVLFFEFVIYYFLGLLTGIFNSPLDFYLFYLKDPSVFFLIGRITVMVSSAVMIFFVYKVAKLLFDEITAIIASFFSAFSLVSIQLSFVAHADMFSVMILVIAFYLGVKGVLSNQGKMVYVSSFLVGLATATKYYCIFGFFFIAAFEIYRQKELKEKPFNIIKEVSKKALVVATGLIAGSPFLLLNIFALYKDTVVLLGNGYIVKCPSKFPLLFHLKYHLKNAFGICLETLFILGIIYSFFRKSRKIFIVAIFPLTFYLLFGNSIGFCHYLLPILPFVAIISAKLLTDILSYLKVTSLWICLFIALLVMLPTISDSLKFVFIVPKIDTRAIAKVWIDKNLPEGSIILEEGCVGRDVMMGPQISPNRGSIERDIVIAKSNGGSGKAYTVILNYFDKLYAPPRFDIYKTSYVTPVDIETSNPEYIVTSGFYDIGIEELDYISSGAYLRDKSINNTMQGYELISEFSPTKEFSLSYPMCMINRDYAILRLLNFMDVKNFVNGPVVRIFKKR